MSRVISTRVLAQPSTNDQRAIYLDGRDYQLWVESFEAIRNESEAEHLKDRELSDALWELVSDLFVHRRNYGKSHARRNRIDEFEQVLLNPHGQFVVYFPVQNLELVGVDLRLDDVTFGKFAVWDFTYSRDASGEAAKFIAQRMVDHPLAFTIARGGHTKKVAERAREKILVALHALRVAAADVTAIHDEQLLFGLGQDHLIAPAATPRLLRAGGWDIGHQPIPLRLDYTLLAAITNESKTFEALFDGSLPEQVKNSLLLALDWISSSTQREDRDDQVLNLCTALEILLIGEKEHEKSLPLAVRTFLLARALKKDYLELHPAEVLDLYDLRSKIIHGSCRRVADKQQVLALRRMATATLSDVVRLAKEESNIQSVDEVIRLIESPERLREAIEYLSHQSDQSSRRLTRWIRKRLSEEEAKASGRNLATWLICRICSLTAKRCAR